MVRKFSCALPPRPFSDYVAVKTLARMFILVIAYVNITVLISP